MILSPIPRTQLESYISLRAGETKLGEVILQNNGSGRFVIVGIQEDIGVKENNGLSGAKSAFEPFLNSFLNTQSNQFLFGNEISILGTIKMEDLSELSIQDKIKALDDCVADTVATIISQGKIPIVIGGGHNNAYGLIKGISTALRQKVGVINCDPHADLRTIDIRHSGNGFSHAVADGFLNQYAMLGLHEQYNNQFIVDTINNNPSIYHTIYWEDIFIRKKMNWSEAIEDTLRFVQNKPFGIELDIDAIENVLSSAMTPVGITPIMAMEYIYTAAASENSSYLHLPEGIAMREDGLTNPTIGKLLSYLVIAFIKGKLKN